MFIILVADYPVCPVACGGQNLASLHARVRCECSDTNGLINDYLDAAGHGTDDNGALFGPTRDNRTGGLEHAITPDGVYKLVRSYSAQLGFETGVHALRATAATNALDHHADIAKVQEWLGHANISTTRIYDHRRTRPEDKSDFQGGVLTANLNITGWALSEAFSAT